MLMMLAASLFLPFLGTVLGAAGVFFLGNGDLRSLERRLSGFAAGVMTAASVWSLILPALEQSAGWGRLAFVPVLCGILAGFFGMSRAEGLVARMDGLSGGSGLLLAAVGLHNLPEGMAVGAAAALWLYHGSISAPAVLALAWGIALQNLPEGAIISMPLRASGMSRRGAFGYGVLSGIPEPVGAAAALVLAGLVLPVLPVLLSFSAGAMLFVTVRELIPEAVADPTRGTALFALGFGLMMALDVALG